MRSHPFTPIIKNSSPIKTANESNQRTAAKIDEV